MEQTVLVNDLKKGTRVQLANGFYATLADSRKGNIREVIVEGYITEGGSTYAKDIRRALIGENWVRVILSPAQEKAAANIRAAGF